MDGLALVVRPTFEDELLVALGATGDETRDETIGKETRQRTRQGTGRDRTGRDSTGDETA